MSDDGVDDVGDDVLSCHGRYYCLSPTLLPTRRELKLNCSRSRPLYEIALGRPNSDNIYVHVAFVHYLLGGQVV